MRRRARAILLGLALLILGGAFVAGCGDDDDVSPVSPARREATQDKPSPNAPGGVHPGSNN